jgi:predicted ribosome quality control (RQC) complex YloA/Tae2 family protein
MKLTECFTQNKNELILGFTSPTKTFYIKAHLQNDFCALDFPDDFSRSKRNSVDLFKKITHKRVLSIRQYLNERCFSINFEKNHTLLFKMHGNRSNILLFKNNELIERFNHQLKNDDTININSLDRPLDQSKEALISNEGDYKVLYPTFDKHIHQYIDDLDYHSKSIPDQWEVLQTVESELLNSTFYVDLKNGKPIFSLLPSSPESESYSDPILAVNTFFQSYIKQSSLLKEKQQINSILNGNINRTKSYIKKSSNKLHTLTSHTHYSQWADIIMANLHLVQPHTKEVVLQDFYNELNPITIKIKPTISPQKNAEIYYRKSKNQKIETNKLQESIDVKMQQLLILETHHKTINEFDDFKKLRNYLKEHQLTKAKREAKEVPKPYLNYHKDGFDIWVGKNSKHNDTLTQKLSYKEDLWLHAKDVSGSHVLVKHRSGQVYPKHVVTYAAQLAAYYSKRRTDSMCPVIYTPKKYVRKLKGAPSGAVMVDKEQVTLVTPLRKEEL